MAGLKRTLGLAALICYGVGMMVGAGVYSVIGAAAGRAGEALWLSFALAAIPAGLAALSYAELASMFPKAGGEFMYLRAALPRQRWAGAITGMVVVFAGAATAATVSIAFAGYLNVVVDVPVWIPAIALLAVCTLVNVAGIQMATWVNVVLTAIEVIGLVLIIWGGLRVEGWGKPFPPEVHAGVFTGAALIFFVYTGFENVVNLAEEAKKPTRDVPRALLVCFGVTLVLYLLVGVSAVALLEPEELAQSEAPLADAARASSGWMGTALGWIAMVSTANTALISLIAGSRLAYAMGRERALPPMLGATLTTRKTPWVAALVVVGIALVLLPLGGVDVVASVSSFASLLAFTAVAAAVIALRKLEPDRERGFRLKPSIGGVPVWPVLQVLAIGALMTQFGRDVYLAGGLALVVATGMYLSRGLWGGDKGGLAADASSDEPLRGAMPGDGQASPGVGPDATTTSAATPTDSSMRKDGP